MKKLFKKSVALVLATVMALSLASCGKTTDEPAGNSTEKTVESTAKTENSSESTPVAEEKDYSEH